jgi:EmrB/QacA subfamily drug resistance transporter
MELQASAIAAPSRRRKNGILAICCFSLFIVGLDVTVVNVALPSIGHDLHASISGLQWTVGAYSVVMASLLMFSGSTADRFGRKRTFMTGITVFTTASFLCSLAPSIELLVLFRVMQAVGASMMNPVAMSIITNVFPDARERARAIGVWSAVSGLSIGIGPLAGGLLTETIGWRSIFWVNVPIGIAAIVLAARFVPESRAPRPRRVDPVGQVLVVATLLGLVGGIIEGPRAGWSSPLIVALFSLAAVSLAALLTYEPRRAEPLIQLRFFRSVPFSGATLVAVAAFSAFGGFLFLNTLYLQNVRGLSALHAGLCTLPLAVAAVVFAPLSGRMVGSFGARRSLVLAGACTTVAAVALTRLTADTPLTLLLAVYFVFGAGQGFVNSPITATAVAGMPREQAGVAAGVTSTSRQLGQSLGVAVAGAVVGGAGGASFAQATHPAWWLVAATGIAVVAAGLVTTTPWARRTAAGAVEEPVALSGAVH